MFLDDRSRRASDKVFIRELHSDSLKFCFDFCDFFGQPLLLRGQVNSALQRKEDLTQRRYCDRNTWLGEEPLIDVQRVRSDQTAKYAEVAVDRWFEDHSNLLIRGNSI